MKKVGFLQFFIFFIFSSLVFSTLQHESSLQIKKKLGKSHLIFQSHSHKLIPLKHIPKNKRKFKRNLKLQMQKQQTKFNLHLLFSEVTQNESLMFELAKLPKPLLSRKLNLMGFPNNCWLKNLLIGMVGGAFMGAGTKLLRKAIVTRKLRRIREAEINLKVKLFLQKKEAEKIRNVREKLSLSLSKIENYKHLLEMNLDSKINSIKI